MSYSSSASEPAVPLSDESEEALTTKLLSRCRKLIAAEDWQAVRELTDDETAIFKQPRLLAFRLTAAENLGDDALYEDVARVLVKIPDGTVTKMAVIRDLAKAGKGDLAATILIENPDLRQHPRFYKLISHVSRGTQDRRLRRAFVKSAVETSGGGLKIKQTQSVYTFAPANRSSARLGEVALEAGPRVPAHHLPGLRKEAETFRKRVLAATQTDKGPKVFEHRNVFTDRFGQIWTETGAIIRGKGRPIAEVSRDTVPNLPVAMMSQSATRGIYHWLVDRVPRFAWLDEPANDAAAVPVLIGDTAPAFEYTCMDMMGIADRIQKVGDAVFVERLIIPAVGFVNLVGWSHVDWGINKLISVSLAKAAEAGVELPERIYISRRDAKRRVMLNEEALESEVAARDFAIYEFSKIPIWHQIALVHSAKTILAPHGAGLAHLILAQPGTQVLEIIPIKDGTYQLRFNYARLSVVKNLDYRAWLEVQEVRGNDWGLDIEPFLAFLDGNLREPAA